MIVLTTVFIICTILFCILYVRKCKELRQYIEEHQQENYAQIQDAQQTIYQEQRKKQTEFRHDMKNIFIALSVFMEDKDYERVSEIIEQTIHETLARPDFINSVDESVNSILNYKMYQAKQAGVHLKTELLLTDTIKINSDELSILLGTIIDNGIEYLSQSDLEVKELTVSMKYDFGILHLSVSNPVHCNISIPSDYALPSTKHENGRGYGISSIKKLVKEHGGILKIYCKDLKFVYDISIPDEM